MGTLIFFFVLSICFSFLCSILEAVLLSITPAYTQQQVASGSMTGMLLEEYKKDIDRPLSAILTLNTLAHTVGAIGVGAQAGAIFGDSNLAIGSLNISYESIIAGLMTLAILILSEIIPKTIGANNWKALTPFSIQTIRIMLILLAPFVWVSQFITKSLKSDKEKSVLSRADFMAMASAGESSGALGKEESMIINNLLNFEKKTVYDIMTPRTVAFMLQEDTTTEEYMSLKNTHTYSRIPLYGHDKDNITGYTLKDEILTAVAEDKNLKLKDLARVVHFVLDDTTLPSLFNQLTQKREHMHIVNDEFGQVVGIVTMEDLFETLLGQEIMDESDTVADLQLHAKKKWEGRKK